MPTGITKQKQRIGNMEPEFWNVANDLVLKTYFDDEMTNDYYLQYDENMVQEGIALIPTYSGYTVTGCHDTAREYSQAVEELEWVKDRLDMAEEVDPEEIGAVYVDLNRFATWETTGDRYTDYRVVVDVDKFRAYTGNTKNEKHNAESILSDYIAEMLAYIRNEATTVEIVEIGNRTGWDTNPEEWFSEHSDQAETYLYPDFIASEDCVLKALDVFGYPVGKHTKVEELTS